MSLYVDHVRIPYRGMLMNHMLSDTTAELQKAERALGIPAGSIQYQDTPKEHLDISESKRNQAIREMAAIEVSSKTLVRMIQKKRAQS